MKIQVYLITFIFLLSVSCNNEKKYLPAPPIKSIQQTFYFAYSSKSSKGIKTARPQENVTYSVDNEHKDYYISYDSLGRVVERHRYDMFCQLVEKELIEYGGDGNKLSYTHIDERGYSKKHLFQYNDKNQLIKSTQYNNERLVDTQVYELDKNGDISRINGIKIKQHRNNKYDKEGNLIEEYSFTVGGLLSSIKEYIYKNGLLIQTNTQECDYDYNPMTGKFIPKWGKKYKSGDYEYTNTNVLLSKTEYEEQDATTLCSFIHKYNAEGNIVEDIQFEDGIKEQAKYYDDSGLLMKEIGYKDNRISDYVYDDRQNLTEIYTTSNGIKSLKTLNDYEFNEYGEWIEKKGYSVYNNNKQLEYIIYRSILYY